MKGHDLEGRFSIDYEKLSMNDGMAKDLQNKVGQQINWFRWAPWYLDDNFESIADDIYDVSSSVQGQGRLWQLPFKLPVLMAAIVRGGNQMNDRGFYVVDTLRIVVSSGDAERLIPNIVGDEPNDFIRDRVEYRGQVFSPIRVNPRGAIGNNYAVVTVDFTEVNKEELVNDPQFVRFAAGAPKDYRND